MITDKLFTEKYRPVDLQGVIGGKDLASLTHLITTDPWSMPNLLLTTRSPGTGKTTIARAIIHDLKADALYLNASDERGIDVIRDKVKEFAMTKSFNSKAPKIVHFDEADGLTRDAQDSLRNLMEEYHHNCRFIFTCNNDNKIIEPIKSRCTVINLNNPPKDQIIGFLEHIVREEKVDLPVELNIIVENFYPDIRSMVKVIEQAKYFGTVELITQRGIAFKIYCYLKEKKFTDARKYWLSSGISFRDAVKSFYELIMEDKDIDKSAKVAAIEEIAEADYRMAVGSDPEITFANLSFKLISHVFK